ncbi:MAG: GNAT family N-acetyltransferase [Candidatus Diapherotrites archaeon]|nr:GNAT family N-acetyltransferase [Candidatus Diapherotrites archaeon]
MKADFKQSKVGLRPAKESDLGFCAELLRKEFSKAPYNEKWTPAKAMRAVRLWARHPKSAIYVIEMGGKRTGIIFGSEFYSEPEGNGFFVEEFAVAEGLQGKGIGRKALALLEKDLKKKGFKALTLLSHRKSKAFKFYQKIGFKKSGMEYLRKIL